MAKIGSGDILIRWDTGEEAVIGTVELTGKKMGMDVTVDVSVWRIGLGMIWLGIQLIMPWRKKHE